MHSLLELIEVFPKDRYTKTINKVIEIFNIFGKSHDTVRVDLLYICGKGKRLRRKVSGVQEN